MNLRWRAFERTARRRVRTELKASPPLWKDSPPWQQYCSAQTSW
jgi:hypothetical protein